MNRTANSMRNVSFGVGLQTITVVFSFVTRTVLIRYIGIEALSINGLFTEVIAALSLAELGIGNTMAYSLYKPVAENNQFKICQLMNMYRIAYRIVAGITFLIGIIMCPWIHYIVNSLHYSIEYIRIIYILFVIQLSTSYLFSYKISLLNVDQKNYIYSKIAGIVKIVGSIFQIALIALIKNYIAYLLSVIAISIITNAVTSMVVDLKYPFLKTSNNVKRIAGEERKTIFSNMKSVFIKGVSARITSSTDNILISTLVSTVLVGYYSNYTIIFNLFRTMVTMVCSGVFHSIGNMMVTESNSRCEKTFRKLHYLFYVVSLGMVVSVYTCISPFISIWLGEDYLLGSDVIFVSCICLFIEMQCKALWTTMEVSGLFSLDKYASIAGSFINLVVSVILGMKIGMAGIFIGTCCTYLIQMLLKAYFLYRKRWNMSPKSFYLIWVKEFLTGLLLTCACSKLCNLIQIPNMGLQFVVNGLISVFIVSLVVILTTHKKEEFRYMCVMLMELKKKLVAISR